MSTGTSRFQPGDVVGQYRLDRELGRGGMAVIFSATGPKDRKVAIKLLQSGFEQSPAVVERFEREGQILRALRHENIARVLEVASLPDRTLYLVIELLEGSDLRQMIDSRGPLSLRTAIQYMVGAASGVAEAHRQGIVHRDLKPANIFISMSGSGQRAVKVLDFGVAKLLAGREEITQTTEMFGAIHYQAPELLTGSNKAQPTADVWALGIVLYHALTCRLPFDRPTIGALCAAISKETPQPIRELRPDVTPQIERILARCLAKKPEERFANAGELANALVALLPEIDRLPDLDENTGRLLKESATKLIPASHALQKRSALDALERRPRPWQIARTARTTSPTSSTNTRSLVWIWVSASVLILAVAVTILALAKPSLFAGKKAVALQVVAQPPGALFSVDYGAQLAAPGKVTLAKDGRSHVVTITKDGYRPETREMKIDSDATLTVDLVPLDKGSRN